MKSQSFEPVINKKRAVYICVYDLQGGPIPPSVIEYLEDAAFNAATMSTSLATTVVVE
jgi:hypothetical protein